MLIQRHHRGELHVKEEYRFGVLDVDEEHGGGVSSTEVKAVKRVRL